MGHQRGGTRTRAAQPTVAPAATVHCGARPVGRPRCAVGARLRPGTANFVDGGRPRRPAGPGPRGCGGGIGNADGTDGMSMDSRTARVALACLVEPGRVEVHRLVVEHGPAGALDALVSGKAAEQVAGAAQARLTGRDARRIAEGALARTER